jgi:hypothetical protein
MTSFLPTILALVILGFFGIALTTASRRQPGSLAGDLLALFLLALAVRCGAALLVNLWLNTATGTPFLFGYLGDDYRYHSIATGLAHRWSQEGFSLPAVLYTRGFETGLGTLYWLLTPSVWVGTAANVVMGSLIPVGTYRLLRSIDQPETAWLAGVLAAIFPPLVFWSTVLYKDTALTVLILVVMIAGTEVLRFGRIWTLAVVVAVVTALGIAVLRLQSLLIVALALVMFALLRPRVRRWSLFEVTSRLLTGLLAAGLVIAVLRTPSLAAEGTDLTWYLGLDRIDLFYETRSLAFQTRSDSVESFFLSLPLQFVASFFLPLPLVADVGSQWQATEHVMLAGNLVWLWLMYYVLIAVWEAAPEERRAWIPVLVMVIATGVAIAVRGYALIYRHKVQMYPFAIMLAAVALHRTAEGRWPRHRVGAFFYTGSTLLVIVLYNFVRVSLSAR